MALDSRRATTLISTAPSYEGKTTLKDAWRMPLLDLGQSAGVEAASQLSNLRSPSS